MNSGMRIVHTLHVHSSKAGRAATESKHAPVMIECARAPIARMSGSPSAISSIDRNGLFKSVDVSEGAVDGHIRGAAPEKGTDSDAQRRRYGGQRHAYEYERERGGQLRGRVVRILGVLPELQESDDTEPDSEQERSRADEVGDAAGLRLKSGSDVADGCIPYFGSRGGANEKQPNAPRDRKKNGTQENKPPKSCNPAADENGPSTIRSRRDSTRISTTERYSCWLVAIGTLEPCRQSCVFLRACSAA